MSLSIDYYTFLLNQLLMYWTLVTDCDDRDVIGFSHHRNQPIACHFNTMCGTPVGAGTDRSTAVTCKSADRTPMQAPHDACRWCATIVYPLYVMQSISFDTCSAVIDWSCVKRSISFLLQVTPQALCSVMRSGPVMVGPVACHQLLGVAPPSHANKNVVPQVRMQISPATKPSEQRSIGDRWNFWNVSKDVQQLARNGIARSPPLLWMMTRNK